MSVEHASQFPADLVGVCKTIGEIGPPYQVIGLISSKAERALVRIVLLESGREVDYPLDDLIRDPIAR